MNIWALRKKLKEAESKADESAPKKSEPLQPTRPTAVPPAPAPTPVAPALPTLTPAPAEPAAPASIGLNDLFAMDDSEIRELSPKLTFSHFKTSKPVKPATTCGTTTSRMKKPSLESLKALHEEREREKKASAEKEKGLGLNDLLTMDF